MQRNYGEPSGGKILVLVRPPLVSADADAATLIPYVTAVNRFHLFDHGSIHAMLDLMNACL
jgi:hypothetical protein